MTRESLERVAVLDHFSAGGVSRLLFALIANMARLHPETTFGYFVSQANLVRDDLVNAFGPYPNVEIIPIRSPVSDGAPAVETPEPDRGAFWRLGVGTLKKKPRVHAIMRDSLVAVREWISPTPAPPPWYHYQLDQFVRDQITGYDVLYVGCPCWIEPFDPGTPLVATFHDFHYKHFPEAYESDRLAVIERQTPAWLQQCTISVTSTGFIRSDLLESYRDVASRTEIVYVAPYSLEMPSAEVLSRTLKETGVRHPYVLYSGALTAHKNVVSLVEATALLRDAGTPIQLVITGDGTDLIGRSSTEEMSEPVQVLDRAIRKAGLHRGDDYLALGYVSNSAVDALSVAADAVVSASLYEAGCGPALDAWQTGVPVAFSNIPPFVEQLEHFGVEAHVFDPHDPADIAAKLQDTVFDYENSQAMAERSRIAQKRYTWDDAAQSYYDILLLATGLGRDEAGRATE